MLGAMSEEPSIPRSPELMSRGDTALLVVDVQERLIGAIADQERMVWNIRRLTDGAKALGMPVLATEQYPKGLGPTVPELAQRLGEVPSKLRFSSCACGALFERRMVTTDGSVRQVDVAARVPANNNARLVEIVDVRVVRIDRPVRSQHQTNRHNLGRPAKLLRSAAVI